MSLAIRFFEWWLRPDRRRNLAETFQRVITPIVLVVISVAIGVVIGKAVETWLK